MDAWLNSGPLEMSFWNEEIKVCHRNIQCLTVPTLLLFAVLSWLSPRVGGRDNFFHCDTCGLCLPIIKKDQHKCVQQVSHSNCPVCMEVNHHICPSLCLVILSHSLIPLCLSLPFPHTSLSLSAIPSLSLPLTKRVLFLLFVYLYFYRTFTHQETLPMYPNVAI